MLAIHFTTTHHYCDVVVYLAFLGLLFMVLIYLIGFVVKPFLAHWLYNNSCTVGFLVFVQKGSYYYTSL